MLNSADTSAYMLKFQQHKYHKLKNCRYFHLGKADGHDSLPEVEVMLESEKSQVGVGEVAVVHRHLFSTHWSNLITHFIIYGDVAVDTCQCFHHTLVKFCYIS